MRVYGHDGTRPKPVSREALGSAHRAQLRRARSLLAGSDQYDTSAVRLACYSGTGFTADLVDAAKAGEVVLVGLADRYRR